jgi:hypothetical protein
MLALVQWTITSTPAPSTDRSGAPFPARQRTTKSNNLTLVLKPVLELALGPPS